MRTKTWTWSAVAVVVGLGALVACSGSPEKAREESKAKARDAVVELRDYVKAHVLDAARAKDALGAVDDLERLLDEGRRDSAGALDELRRTNARYDATRAELQAVVDAYAKKRKATRAAAIALHVRLRDAVPAEIWSKVFDLEEAAIQAKLAIAPAESAPGKGGNG